MKKLFLLICIIYPIVSCTKTEDPVVNYNFKIENLSGKNIVIKSYKSTQPTILIKSIIIENNNSHFEFFTNKQSDKGYLFEDVFRGDSIEIDYNNGERKEIFSCVNKFSSASGCSEPRNVLSSYNAIPIGNNINSTYTFTVDDYNNAND